MPRLYTSSGHSSKTRQRANEHASHQYRSCLTVLKYNNDAQIAGRIVTSFSLPHHQPCQTDIHLSTVAPAQPPRASSPTTQAHAPLAAHRKIARHTPTPTRTDQRPHTTPNNNPRHQRQHHTTLPPRSSPHPPSTAQATRPPRIPPTPPPPSSTTSRHRMRMPRQVYCPPRCRS